MRYFHQQNAHSWKPIINLDKVRGSHDEVAVAICCYGIDSRKCPRHTADAVLTSTQLWSLVPGETRDAYVNGSKKDTVPVLDLLPLGYSKVLGKGRLPEIPLVVRARWVSKLAEKKIQQAGGVVELVA